MKYELFKSIFTETIKREPEISETKLRKFLDPEYFISVREQLGGPGPQVLRKSLDNYKDKLIHLRKNSKKIKEFEEAAINKLKSAVGKYM